MVLKEKKQNGSKKIGKEIAEKINSWHDSLRIDKFNRINDMSGTREGINELEKVEAALQESQG